MNGALLFLPDSRLQTDMNACVSLDPDDGSFLLINPKNPPCQGIVKKKDSSSDTIVKLPLVVAYPQVSGRPFFERILLIFGCSVDMHLSWHLLLEAPPAKYPVYVDVGDSASFHSPLQSASQPALLSRPGCFPSELLLFYTLSAQTFASVCRFLAYPLIPLCLLHHTFFSQFEAQALHL